MSKDNQPAPGGVVRGDPTEQHRPPTEKYNRPKAQQPDALEGAKERSVQRVNEDIQQRERLEGVRREGEIRGEQMADDFDIDNFLASLKKTEEEHTARMQNFDRFDKVRKEGLNDDQKNRLKALREKYLSGAPQDPPPAGGAATPPVQEPNMLGTPPAQTKTPTSSPPAQDPKASTPSDPGTGAEDTDKEPGGSQLADLRKSIDTMTETFTKQQTEMRSEIDRVTGINKGLIKQRDELKTTNADLTRQISELRQENVKVKFSIEAKAAGIPADLMDVAMGKAQAIVDHHGSEMSWSDIFKVMKQQHPSFFKGAGGDNTTQLKPGAANTGRSGGGSPTQDPADTIKPAENFNDVRKNIQKRLSKMG